MTITRKKLIEVALPLPEINDASSYDKLPGIGPHPKGIHHWWARLPLPTARAVLFASVVDDPSQHPEKWPTEQLQDMERERLFDILRRMMAKKLHGEPEVYAEATAEMLRQVGGKLPVVFDPFAGGGSIPLEANRLGFDVFASDLNPIAVLLNKCNLELAPRWSGCSPVNPGDRRGTGNAAAWRGTHGLAADVRYYGRRIRERAIELLGPSYPKVRLPEELGGGEAEVITWLWARTVASPDPAARGKKVPLISTFWLSKAPGSEAWLELRRDKTAGTYGFEVRAGKPDAPLPSGTKATAGGFTCVLTDTHIPFEYIRSEGQANRLGTMLLAVVARTRNGKAFLSPDAEQIAAADISLPSPLPDTDLPEKALGFRVQNYGITKHWQLFTPRQLTALVILSDLVREMGTQVQNDASAVGLSQEEAIDYSRAVTTFLALAVDRCASFNNSFCRWNGNQTTFIFKLQAISMVWDFSEANILGVKSVGWNTAIGICADALETIAPSTAAGATVTQADAASTPTSMRDLMVSTDPPYYDNIGYAALSDFYYVWARRSLASLHPELFSTVLVPKLPELTASPERFGDDRREARRHFESGFRKAFGALRKEMDPRFPLTVYYAFKQDDEETDASDQDDAQDNVDLTTGWETLLEALVSSGFQITATWPVRASFRWRTRALQANALASYIVLACRPRAEDAPQIDRRSFVMELRSELPPALRRLQQGNIAPVDFAQAAIGPGMAIYSRYGRILESSGTPMPVRSALAVISKTLTEVLSEQEDDFDGATRWAIAWLTEHGFSEGPFEDAHTYFLRYNTSDAGLRAAGLIRSGAGKVRLLRPDELPIDWDPSADKRITVWEMTHHLIRVYYIEKAGDEAAARLLAKMGSQGDVARELAYRLFDLSEKKKRAQDALAYNALVLGWSEIARLARDTTAQRPTQGTLV